MAFAIFRQDTSRHLFIIWFLTIIYRKKSMRLICWYAGSKSILTKFNSVWNLNVVKYFWSWSIFHLINGQTYFTMIKNIWHCSQYIERGQKKWTRRWIRHEKCPDHSKVWSSPNNLDLSKLALMIFLRTLLFQNVMKRTAAVVFG